MDEDFALNALMDGAVEFFVSHEAMQRGAYHDEEVLEVVRGVMLAGFAYLSVQARKMGVEEELNDILYLVSQGDGL